ncbi:MAG TPA: alpha/beta hydrolase [Candidatus Paceibacterota bacterium]
MEKERNLLENPERIFDLSPDVLKSTTPLLFVPGWSNSAATSREGLKDLASHGRRVLSLVPTPGEQSEKAKDLLELLKTKGVEKTDALAYSEGAINLSLAALAEPDRFRNIVLIDPAGTAEHGSMWEMASRFAQELSSEMKTTLSTGAHKKEAHHTVADVLGRIGRHPVTTVRELREIAETDIFPILGQLHESGIGISIITGVDDKIFEMQEFQDKKELGKYIDGFYSVAGGHAEIIKHPDQYMSLADQALDALEARSKNKSSSKED